MNLWNLLRPTVRTLEPESMDSPQAAIVYDKVARAHAFLDKLFVRRAMKLGISQGRALDVGCGSGLLSIELSRAAPKLSIFALDLSEAMLELAERNAKEAGARNITFVRGDAKALPFKDESFDVVLSQHTLHHIPEPEGMLLEMKRMAKVGGYVLVRDLRRPRWPGLISLHVKVFGHIYDGLGSYSAMGKALYRQSLAAALSAPEWTQLSQRCGICGSCVSKVPFLNHMDIALRKAVRKSTEL